MKRNRRTLIGIIAGVAVLLAGIIGGGYLLTGDSRKEFPADGYVLEIVSEETTQNVTGLTFSVGTQYRGKFPSSYVFKDIQGKKNTIDSESFIHYSDGSLSAFSDGMTVNMQEVGQGFLEFYRVKEGMVMTKASEGWEIDNNQNVMSFPEMLWLLSDNKVLSASDDMTLVLAGREPEKISGYLEVTWLDKDVVQVANQDTVYQTVTTGGKITYNSGAVLDLQSSSVLGKDGGVSFTLSELQADMTDGGIAIQSDSASNWQPPEFNIQTENGKDGEAGKSGEIGKNGEIGEDGEAGETGEDGEAGEFGEDGEAGREGEQGRAGAVGTTGATGAGGGSAGSGGVSGGSGNAGSGMENKLGTIRVTNLEYDCSSVKVYLTALDESSTFLANTGVVEIRDAVTNKLLGSEEGVDIRDEGAISKEFTFTDILSADREYTLVVKNDYAVAMQSGDTNSGTKTFVKRNFFTSSEGVIMEVGRLREDSLKLNLKQQSSTTARYFALRIKAGDKWLSYPQGGGCEEFPFDNQVELRLAELLNTSAAGQEWESNIPYEIELYTSDTNNQAQWQDDGANGEPKGTGKEIKKSAQVLKGKTLKKKPKIGEVNAVLSNNGYYDLSVNVEEDKDKSIKNYKFTVLEDLGNDNERVLQELETTSYQTKWYFGGALQGQYRITCEVTYYDNEKDNIVNAQPASITATAVGSPSLSFEPYRNVSGEWVNHSGQPIADADSTSSNAVNATRIWGELKLSVNGKKINTQTAVAIKITANDTTTYERTISQSLPQGQTEVATGETVYWIPIKCLGLKADTVYTFDISGEVEDTLNVGDAAMTQKRVEWLGTTSVKTTGINGTALSAEKSIAGFTITTRINDSQDRERIAALQLYAGSSGGYLDKTAINSVDMESEYYFERSIARAVQVGVYQENGTKYGTIVKDLYPSDWSAELVAASDTEERELEETNGYSPAESGYFFKSPLVRTPGDEYYLLKEDFRRGGMNIDNMRGKIVLKAEALYDYGYKLQEDSALYGDYFLDTAVPNYNVMRLNEVDIYSGGSIIQTLNNATIDLGEKPPTLFNPAHTAITVTEMKNSPTNETRYTEVDLKTDTTIGLKAASNYPNDNGDTTEITYYAMTADTLWNYETNKGSDSVDIIDAYRKGLDIGKDVLFGITLRIEDYNNSSDKGVPPLYVVFTENEEYLDQCRTEVGGAGTGQYSYYAVKDRNTNRAIFYTDLMERGHCYVFAFTLKSMYHVNTMTGETAEAWEFPYDITQYVTTEVYNGAIQRSTGTEVYRETPRVAAYLDHTTLADAEVDTEDTAVWNYLVYDPDGARDGLEDTLFVGRQANVISQISKERLGLSLDYSLLGFEKTPESEVTNTAYTNGEGLRSIFSNSFKLDAFPKRGKVSRFTVTVKDKENQEYLGSLGSLNIPYEIWLATTEFEDTNTGRQDGSFTAYLSTRRTQSNDLLDNKAEHFAVGTAVHMFDSFTEDMSELKVEVGLNDGTDNVFITVGSGSLANRLVGLYYELRSIERIGKAEQWGFIPKEETMQIPLQNPAAGTIVELYLQAVYDTGIAGINLERIRSDIHLPKGEGEPSPGETDYYAIQEQYNINGSSRYATSENYNTRRFIYGQATPGNSLYRIEQSNTAPDTVYQYVAHRWSYTGQYNTSMNYIYGTQGGYLDSSTADQPEMPVFKKLAESDVQLLLVSENGNINKNDEGKVLITVPAVRPNISGKSINYDNLHSANLSVTFTEKSIETLLMETNAKYVPEVYFELYEDAGEGAELGNPLNNSGNRYFAFVTDEEKGNYANKAKSPAIVTNGYRVDSGGDITAYLMPEKGTTQYRIAVRNLELGKAYVFKMYCLEKATGNKVYIIDNDVSSGRPSGDAYAQKIPPIQNQYLNIGSLTNNVPLTAGYIHNEYGKRNLDVNYYLSKRGDFYLRYQLKVNGNFVQGAEPEKMMEFLGYTEESWKTWYHYDESTNKWVGIPYPVYRRTDGTEYTNVTYQNERFQFGDANLLTSAGTYQLEIAAIDLYTGEEVESHTYRQNDKPLEGELLRPTIDFTVPARGNIIIEPRVTYEKVVESAGGTAREQDYARLTLTVRDNGLRLGVLKDGTLEMGYYQVVLEKATDSGWEEVTLTSDMIAGNRTNDGLFMKATTYTISYEVANGERYRLRVQGVDILDEDESKRDKMQDLYDSESDSTMKVNLSVTGLDKPQLGNPAFDFNIDTREFTISVRRGINLDQINRVAFTLYNMSGEQQISGYDTIPCRFGNADSKGWQDMVISLDTILSGWITDNKIDKKDSLILTVQYMGDGGLLGENTFSFMYK